MLLEKENLLKTLEMLPEILEAYSKNIPEDVLDRKRSDTAWTIREHLYHIANVQEMLYLRIQKIRDEETPVITPYLPDDQSPQEGTYQSVDKAFSHYKEWRKKQMALIQELTESDLGKEATHGEYISYNIPIIINHIVFHEYWHMFRVEEIWLTKDEYFS